MKNDFNGIEEYPDTFTKDYCDDVIKHFDVMATRQLSNSRNNANASDETIVLDWAHTSNQYHYDYRICDHFYNTLHGIYTSEYQEKYAMLKSSEQHSAKGMAVQKTRPHQGYHAWHQESGNIGQSPRVINYMLYLNDVDEGGETQILDYKIKPEAGKLLLFPPFFKYIHRGNIPISSDKYIITGWLHTK